MSGLETLGVSVNGFQGQGWEHSLSVELTFLVLYMCPLLQLLLCRRSLSCEEASFLPSFSLSLSHSLSLSLSLSLHPEDLAATGNAWGSALEAQRSLPVGWVLPFSWCSLAASRFLMVSASAFLASSSLLLCLSLASGKLPETRQDQTSAIQFFKRLQSPLMTWFFRHYHSFALDEHPNCIRGCKSLPC